MAITINSPGWRIKRLAARRGVTAREAEPLPGVPPQFLTPQSQVAEEAILEPAATTRGRDLDAGRLDLSFDVEPGQAAVLAVRHPSGALTFHLPIEATIRGTRALAQVRFQEGVGTYLDVINAQHNYTDALIDKANAIIDYNSSQARLLHAIGCLTVDTCTASQPLRREI